MDKKLSFAVDASQIDIKPLLQKEFLELTMKAISSANPNRNNSWFTEESLIKGAPTFKNKPILGYFENGDFVSHNGEWSSDPETNMDYWNTLDGKGERILGVIRSEDDVEVVKDEKGLSWICLSCILWTQYSYKQVKRLLKDAKKAKENGGTTKNISVEVDITDYEELPNGVIKINDFNLVGITILGSRNGVKVEPGIEDAELSVVDVMGKEYFAKQEKALRLAYEKLDNSKQNIEKEGEAQMTVEKNDLTTSFEETCPVCNQNPCICEDQGDEVAQNEASKEDKEQTEETENMSENGENTDSEQPKDCEENADFQQSENQSSEDDDDDDDDDDENENEEQNNEHCEEQNNEHYEEDNCSSIENNEGCGESNFEASNTITVTGESDTTSTTITTGIGTYTIGSDTLTITNIDSCECNSGVVNVETFETEFNELSKSYNELEEKYNEALTRIAAYEKADFLKEVSNILNSVESLTEEQRNTFTAQCENGEITSIDDLKIKVALLATFTTVGSASNAGTTNVQIERTDVYSAPVISPNTNVFGSKAEKPTKESKWETLQEYNGKN